jgi:hypothetical protein
MSEESILAYLGIEPDELEWAKKVLATAHIYDHAVDTMMEAAESLVRLTPDQHANQWLVFILRDDGQGLTTFAVFDNHAEAETFYETASAQRSDSYLCRVERGPMNQ